MTNKLKNINLSIPRRQYYNNDCSLTICPECGSDLIDDSCSILLCAESDTEETEFMTNLSGSHFCNKCPVVVFDTNMIKQAVAFGAIGGKNLRYYVGGIVDLASIPANKKNLVIGSDENPMPLVHFLPDLDDQSVNLDKK